MDLKLLGVGADPEVFIKFKGGNFLPVEGLIGGTKRNPRQITEGYFVQEDNVLAEFNIPPAKSGSQLKKSVNFMLKYLSDCLPDDLEISIVPFAEFSPDDLVSDQSRAFGCTPDFNVWTDKTNPIPCANNPFLRTAAGHLHLGYENPSISKSIHLTKVMDMFISVPATLMSEESPRKELYGKMGTVRFKKYGVEYRTPSNFWITSSNRIEWVYEQIIKGFEHANKQKGFTEHTITYIEEAVNNGNKKVARYLCDEYKLNLAI